MSKVVTLANASVQIKGLFSRVSKLERLVSTTSIKEVNTTGLTATQIDAAVFSNNTTSSIGAQPSNGVMISDPTNKLILVRQAGAWTKFSGT